MNVNVCDHIRAYNEVKTFDYERNFVNLINILKLDINFEEYMKKGDDGGYINCIYVCVFLTSSHF